MLLAARPADAVRVFTFYVKRPIVVQAVQLTYANIRQVATWIGDQGGGTAGLSYQEAGELDERGIWIGTLEGVMEARIGSWIIKGPMGEFYPCQDEVFRLTYDRAAGPGLASSQPPPAALSGQATT